MTVISIVGAGPAFAQSDASTTTLPDVVTGAQVPELALPVVPLPTVEPVVPDVVPTGEELIALRDRFENLKQRQAENMALRQAASAQTSAQIESINAAIVANEGKQQIARWRTQNLEILSQAFVLGASDTLPAGIPAGTEPSVALAVIDAQTTLYSQPMTDAQTVIRTIGARETMLRVAELGAFTLVWSPQDEFAFVLSQFREVY
ncbi:hypothetical protein AN191_16330 [Loktanella sp. 5RATIMAR09]|uniref:hypothetical protein n=1 Tax=Loktanella sp. 5RATIMAR09 TaxID=1225655 RepID=UPI0006EB9EFA|nr:hypothetical protein [Loktanella sp. 5RATIMAR09]KQI70746.1 hypothetical protein AN191_16330 [Loktanella sp. 5RATIMAR09]